MYFLLLFGASCVGVCVLWLLTPTPPPIALGGEGHRALELSSVYRESARAFALVRICAQATRCVYCALCALYACAMCAFYGVCTGHIFRVAPRIHLCGHTGPPIHTISAPQRHQLTHSHLVAYLNM